MSWTTPVVPVSGTLITASWGSTTVVDNLLALYGMPHFRCNAYHSTQQTVTASATNVGLALDSEVEDAGGMHSTSSNTHRVTVQSGGAGHYVIFGSTLQSGNPSTIGLRKNSTTLQSLTSTETPIRFSYYLQLAVGDIIDMAVLTQDSGGDATFGHASDAARQTRLIVFGPLPPV